ncbi:alpha/beta hydrolase fold protein [Streptomyces lincolnensis]|uniref:Alpha/beta hydrolase fold protein n=1 Tax=Streptomyces lincolnensis TaxID=1915 RepID=A0A1B1M1E2_STRLN|nr:alpha/beta hydrolase [Streptomyces lincolnensis]ANS62242.1 alpha/beta hydrolase fold protein [Streptomyces lincolnensis]ANS70797.1 alpha/beta hydrolase fold protein [Streptomyces lincolnensis]AXG51173.1 alpha/beta hydrolase fold protein [Streptomyces lincolnensis]QMV04261.1 alpha/beta fold hydrolase [Streptomyces lincolnensis]QMV12062.1 alpha/beta fold hydrolase [Streptomyces lincolnensis]
MTMITTPTGVSLTYGTFGDPDHPPLLLIQGLGAHMLGWRADFCRQLADQGFHVLRFDNRDVGLSQKFPQGGYTLADLANDTAGLLTALGIPSAHIVGQSMGGMVAQQLALDHPTRVLTLALVYTAPSTDFLAGRDLVDERTHRPRARNRDEAITLYLDNEAVCASPGYPQDITWLRELGGQMYDRDHDPDGIERQLESLDNSPDRTPRLHHITVPTTILHGDGDRLISADASKLMHELIADSKLTIYPGMGHELPRPLWPQIITQIRDNAVRGSA